MYHIKHDKRAESSVELICTAVLELLETKPLGEITISDVQRRSTVSRSTFYRNFDSLEDVLALLCDRGFDEIAALTRSRQEAGRRCISGCSTTGSTTPLCWKPSSAPDGRTFWLRV